MKPELSPPGRLELAATHQAVARRSGFGLLLALGLAAAMPAFGQSNGEPGAHDYAAFSHFIADRNIFDPNRQPHDYTRNRSVVRRIPQRPRATPGIQFVGTMQYEKGLFAFFSGNSEDLSRIAAVGDQIQGYAITSIESRLLVLETPDKKSQALNLGDGLRQENNKWVISLAGDLSSGSGADTAATADSSGAAGSTSSAPPSTSEPNDILRRLKQLREKENQ